MVHRVWGFVFFISLSLGSLAQADSPLSALPEELYQASIRSYQSGDLHQARDQFKKLAQQDPKNRFALYNWGLVEFELGHKGYALAAWRRALYISPLFSPARRALRYAQEQMTGRLGISSPSTWESFRGRVLTYFSLGGLMGWFALSLALGGGLWLRFFSRYQEAVEHELPLPRLSLPLIFVGGLGAVLGLLLALKIYDYQTPRATLVSDRVPLLSAPVAESSDLLLLNEGMEVLVRQSQGDWAQVTFPGGMTGWVHQDHLFLTSGRGHFTP